MATPYIMPLGFIDRATDTGATFILTNPEDSLGLRIDTSVTVWRYSPEHLAIAKAKGLVTAVGYTTATFVKVDTLKAPRWPENEDILSRASPVFLALEGSFEPDPSRKVTAEKAEALRRIAARYAELTAMPGENHPDNDRPET